LIWRAKINGSAQVCLPLGHGLIFLCRRSRRHSFVWFLWHRRVLCIWAVWHVCRAIINPYQVFDSVVSL